MYLPEFRYDITNADQRFLKLMKKNTVFVNAHYQIPLYLRNSDVKKNDLRDERNGSTKIKSSFNSTNSFGKCDW